MSQTITTNSSSESNVMITGRSIPGKNPLPLSPRAIRTSTRSLPPTPFAEPKNTTDEVQASSYNNVQALNSPLWKDRQRNSDPNMMRGSDKSDVFIAGYAFFYANYSITTNLGSILRAFTSGESYRKLGMGRLLFGTVASIAANNGFASVEGIVAVWNKKSYDFYIDMGVEIFDEFRYGKLHGENLQKYADKGEK
ncbi:Diamine acetyltransferase 1 [Datura stramonium]|uniref:Diamine acetyltransferase 1 n=1 Tax=Datura stramonium TaxID=4076 RepID=A0ABS8SPS1_DATST|nr:Diamine acetyltransferase 1 [Datura stramonium]